MLSCVSSQGRQPNRTAPGLPDLLRTAAGRKEAIMPEAKKDRLQYVDVAKAFAIFLVVLGHPRPVEDYGSLEQFLYAFHMPLFFFM